MSTSTTVSSDKYYVTFAGHFKIIARFGTTLTKDLGTFYGETTVSPDTQ